MNSDLEPTRDEVLRRVGRKLLVGTGMFEVYDEPLPDGHFRTLYKNKE